MILELAVRGACDIIVTYNIADFKKVDMFGINIQTPADFLKTIKD
jgi:predicted nucleic acid-binding protein